MSDILTRTVILETLVCGKCGITFAMPKPTLHERREDRASFWCPNGHERVFRETEADRLRRELKQTQKHLEWAESSKRAAWDQARAAERSKAALKGVVTKQRKRAVAGICPCCNRSFQQLRRHMTTKHPDYAEQPVDGAA